MKKQLLLYGVSLAVLALALSIMCAYSRNHCHFVYADAEALMAQYEEMYQNPLMRMGITFLEILPVGLSITFISAAFLRKALSYLHRNNSSQKLKKWKISARC